MPSTYDIGDMVFIRGKFSTAAGSTEYLDPTVVGFHIETPSNDVTSYTVSPPTTSADIVRETTGEFLFKKLTTESGRYEYRWTSTGVVDASEENGFLVRIQAVTT